MAAFQEALGELSGEGVQVVGASVDAAADATPMAEKLGLEFPVLHSLPLIETVETLGAFYETRRSILHATGFVVEPDGVIDVVCYSTGAIGRLEVEDVLRLVRFRKRQQAK